MYCFKSTIVELLQKLKIQYKYFADTIVLSNFEQHHHQSRSINI